MKNTAAFIFISFVVGALIGFGADRLVLRNRQASEERKMEQQAESENAMEDESSAEVMGPESEKMAAEPQEAMMEKKEESMMGKEAISLGPVEVSLESAGKNTISVEDQAPGREVQIKSVTVSGNSWVVIHEDAEGKPSRILGAQRFNPGTYANRSVELVNNAVTADGKAYYAMVHADDGDKQFDYKIDLPIKDADGNPITTPFTATARSATQ